MCVQGDDLLILAGPTMSLDGPVRVYRWPGGVLAAEEMLVERDVLTLVAEVPSGAGEDHAEGIALFPQADGQTGLLVVYDNAAAGRKQGEDAVLADVLTVAVTAAAAS